MVVVMAAAVCMCASVRACMHACAVYMCMWGEGSSEEERKLTREEASAFLLLS